MVSGVLERMMQAADLQKCGVKQAVHSRVRNSVTVATRVHRRMKVREEKLPKPKARARNMVASYVLGGMHAHGWSTPGEKGVMPSELQCLHPVEATIHQIMFLTIANHVSPEAIDPNTLKGRHVSRMTPSCTSLVHPGSP